MAGPTSNAPPIAGTNGGDIAQQLMSLVQPILSSPKGQAMASAIISQLQGGGGGGMPPMGTSAAQAMGGNGSDMETAQFADENDMARPEAPRAPVDDYATGEVGPRGAPQQVPNTGGLNQDGPTPQEVQMLKSNPSERNVRNFMKLFGPEITQQILGQGGQEGANLGTAPGSGGPSYEDDVNAALDEADDGDHEYR